MSLYTLLRCSNVVCDILDQTAATRYKPQACYGYMYKVKRKPYKVGGQVDDVSQLCVRYGVYYMLLGEKPNVAEYRRLLQKSLSTTTLIMSRCEYHCTPIATC